MVFRAAVIVYSSSTSYPRYVLNRIGNLPVDLYSFICYDSNKTRQYSSSSTINILYLNILYIVVGVGKIYGCHRGHREQSRE